MSVSGLVLLNLEKTFISHHDQFFSSPEPKAHGELLDWSSSVIHLNHWSKFRVTHMNVPHNALFKNCLNASAPPNRRAARALGKKIF